MSDDKTMRCSRCDRELKVTEAVKRIAPDQYLCRLCGIAEMSRREDPRVDPRAGV